VSNDDLLNEPIDTIASAGEGESGPPPPAELVYCNLCQRGFKNNNGLGVHMATMHKGNRKKRKARTLRALVNTPADDAIHTDDIFFATVQSLFPSGEIPLPALLPLMRWREATDQLLQEVQRVRPSPQEV
jgi:hypothetical protein